VNIHAFLSSCLSAPARYASLPALAGAALLSALSGCSHYTNDLPPIVDTPNSVAIADVNGDGSPDLLVATTADTGGYQSTGFANVILNAQSPPGSFHTGVHYATTGYNPSSIAVADLTGSKRLDLVIANFGSGTASVFMHGATPGTFNAATTVTTGGSPNQVVIGDVNGDGNPDLVLADGGGSGNVIVVLQNAGSGTFGAPINLLTANGLTINSAAIGDLNGDGKPDIVATAYDANGNNGAVYVFLQSATTPGTFLAPVAYPAGAQPQVVRIADVNGDGLPDLVVGNLGPGADGLGSPGVSVLLQQAGHPGVFLAPVSYSTGHWGTVDLAVGDLNGDAKPDIVAANLGPSPSGSVNVLLQDPAHPGVFLTATSYAGFGQPLAVAIGDLNNDGRPDIAVADGTTATVLLQTSTPGTFAQAVQVGN